MAEFALFVGVDSYPRDLSIPPLRYAQADAVELWAVFKGRLGYGDRARLLQAPSAVEVNDALDELGQQVRSGDTFVFYFSGHGRQVGGDQYLLMPRANLAKLNAGDVRNNDVLSLDGLLSDVARWPGQANALFLLDACRSRSDGAGHRDDGRFQAEVEAVLSDLASRDPGLRVGKSGAESGSERPSPLRPAIMNACLDGGQAYEIGGTVRRGIFSLALQRHAEDHVTKGRPWLVTPQTVGELSVLMQQSLPAEFRDRVQRPWLNRGAPPVRVWRPAAAPDAPTTPSAPPPQPEDTAGRLTRDFLRQLRTGQWHRPVQDCCVATLALMRQAGMAADTVVSFEQFLEQAQASASGVGATDAAPPNLAAQPEQAVPETPMPMPMSQPGLAASRLAARWLSVMGGFVLVAGALLVTVGKKEEAPAPAPGPVAAPAPSEAVSEAPAPARNRVVAPAAVPIAAKPEAAIQRCSRFVVPYTLQVNAADLIEQATRGSSSANTVIPIEVRTAVQRMNWLPMPAEVMHGQVWLEKWGDNLLERHTRLGSALYPKADAMLAQLLASITEPHDYKFVLHISKEAGTNVVALPGGAIVMAASLVKDPALRDKAKLYLAHEIAHLLQRHATRELQARIIDSTRGTTDLISAIRLGQYNPRAFLQTVADKQWVEASEEQEIQADNCAIRMVAPIADRQELAAALQSLVGHLAQRARPGSAARIENLKSLVASLQRSPG